MSDTIYGGGGRADPPPGGKFDETGREMPAAAVGEPFRVCSYVVDDAQARADGIGAGWYARAVTLSGETLGVSGAYQSEAEARSEVVADARFYGRITGRYLRLVTAVRS